MISAPFSLNVCVCEWDEKIHSEEAHRLCVTNMTQDFGQYALIQPTLTVGILSGMDQPPPASGAAFLHFVILVNNSRMVQVQQWGGMPQQKDEPCTYHPHFEELWLIIAPWSVSHDAPLCALDLSSGGKHYFTQGHFKANCNLQKWLA